MYDSTRARDIPPSADLVAGYVDGRYAWSAADWARWPVSKHVAITISAWHHNAIVLDVEPGDATPEQCNGWLTAIPAATGWIPTLYGNRPALDRARHLAELVKLEVDYWLADWTGTPHLPIGFSACQYAAPGHGSPGHYDLSVVADNWPRAAT